MMLQKLDNSIGMRTEAERDTPNNRAPPLLRRVFVGADRDTRGRLMPNADALCLRALFSATRDLSPSRWLHFIKALSTRCSRTPSSAAVSMAAADRVFIVTSACFVGLNPCHS